MKENSDKKKLKNYETSILTWNKGRFGRYKTLTKINKEAFKKSVSAKDKET
tara:strand:+ start:202 stop:354 length:153 start_codon:yes stop_codon:yes gene_type:complete